MPAPTTTKADPSRSSSGAPDATITSATPTKPTTPPSHPQHMPLTPPLSPGPNHTSHLSLDSTNSISTHRSHKEYLDTLQAPSQEEFQRLASVQEERAREHKWRDRELIQKSLDIHHKTVEAQKDFALEKLHERVENLRVEMGQDVENGRPEAEGDKAGFPNVVISAEENSKIGDRAYAPRDVAEDDSHSKAISSAGDEDKMRSKAAAVIQRSYRGYRVRREMKGLNINASTRWTEAIRDAQWRELTTPRKRGDSLLAPEPETGRAETGTSEGGRPRSSTSATARQNWKKAAFIARRAGGDEDPSGSDSESDLDSGLDSSDHPHMTAEQRVALRKRREEMKAKRRKRAQMMGLQYFLEMVDLKHRYGSNLRQYHEEWKKADTNENFFYWLDHGEGRNVSLPMCPRDRLDREQVRYLNREERQHYLVKVDSEGRLCWAKNGVRIDTTEEWKDSIHGIVPADDPTPSFQPQLEPHHNPQDPDYPHDGEDDSGSDSGAASESELEAARAAKYADPSYDEAKGVKKVRHVSAATIFNKLLRKSVRKNTWIFVADTSFRLYVGIKNSGAFQHSSFLHGSRISAAGLIKIKNGRLASLSPLSGHYRPPASNFRAFVHSLRDEGVDMSHVSISKSYAVLVGLEAYVKTRKKGKEMLQRVTHHKEKILDPEQVAEREEAERDKSESAAIERRVLAQQEEQREGNKTSVRFLEKLGLRPRTPKGQQQGDGAKHEEDERSKMTVEAGQ